MLTQYPCYQANKYTPDCVTTAMTIRYTRDFSAQDFLELAQQVWPGPYDLQEVTLALKYTLNIGACDDDRDSSAASEF